MIGAILLVLLVGGGGVFFVVALVKSFTRKTTGWIVTASILGFLGLALLGTMLLGFAVGITKAIKQSDLDQVLTSKDGRYSISVPGAWNGNTAPDGVTCLEARSRFPARHVMVIALGKDLVQRPLADYAAISTERITSGTKNGVRSDPESLALGSYPAIRYRVSGNLEDSEVVYHLTFVETPGALCQISCWSLQSDEGIAKPIFEKVAASFVENPK